VDKEPRIRIYKVTWEELTSRLETLAKQLPQDATIFGILRGGHIIAGMLSFIRPDLKLRLAPLAATWTIDDIADTGATLAKHRLPNNKFLTVFRRWSCSEKVDLVSYQLPQVQEDLWIQFPYDNPDYDKPGTRQSGA